MPDRNAAMAMEKKIEEVRLQGIQWEASSKFKFEVALPG